MGNANTAGSGSTTESHGDDNDLVLSAVSALVGGSLLSMDCKSPGIGKDDMHGSSELLDTLHGMTLVREWNEDFKESFQIIVRTLTGKDLAFDHMSPDTTVAKLKGAIADREGIPIDQQRLIFHGQQLENPLTLHHYGVNEGSTLHLVLRLRGGWYPSQDLLDPDFHYDFTNLKDKGESFCRGDKTYSRPYGWKRYALKVRGKYKSDTWLGLSGHRLQSSSGEWPVSYHGTSQTGGEGIAEKGYDMARGKRFLFGRGIYSTPDPTIAELYALPFTHKGKSFKVMVQNRYDSDHTKVIENMNYLVTEEEEFIRPYGVLVQKM